ncbi:MAG: hypothetical protein JNM42_00680 [Propionivibrio sp.]|uniref:complex I subunit 5 family protein n=1 Tax=Propionivibrio sp. TaxID=2212460 RepID=UPI001A4AF8F0|nr:proton-conducting transporter membrane subunit [Propionivibrio sp.]MBL8412936.1 hypothetical protein [Propionivibrio sp.]
MNFPDFNAALLLGAIALPLLLAAGMAQRGWRSCLLRLAPWAALPALLVMFVVPQGAAASFSWLFLGSHLGFDQTGYIYLLFTSTLWLLSGLFAQTYLVDDPKRSRFFAFYLLAMAGNFGLILAQDLVTFYVFFSLMSFSSYVLVIHNGENESLRAGRIYLCLVVLGELMLFAAMVTMATNANSILLRDAIAEPMSDVTLALLLLGFGIKAGALPLHVWLPLAHPAAPVPASAVLSGAMIKAGLLGWIRFLPLGLEAFPQWGALVMGAGLAAAFFGALVGVTQTNPKTVLAYSSISQMGLITIAVGVVLMVPSLWPTVLTAILIYALHHALAKGALFLGVGVASHAATRAQRLWLFVGMLVPALALIGAPFTSGAIAKTALKADFTSLPAPWADLLQIALPLAAIGTTLLMARFLWLLWSKPSAQGHSRYGLWIAWALLLVAVALVAWVLPIANFSGHEALKIDKIWAGLWPLALGIMAAWVALERSGRNGGIGYPRIPAGDWLALLAWAAPYATRIGRNLPNDRLIVFWKVTAASSLRALLRLGSALRWSRMEDYLRSWSAAGMALLCITVILYLLASAS